MKPDLQRKQFPAAVWKSFVSGEKRKRDGRRPFEMLLSFSTVILSFDRNGLFDTLSNTLSW